ncbi:MAG: hypothetical protein II233_06095 [Clostridia bacterium]|nr:hypothetical protein [Clostridia bacterium]
MRKYIFKKIAGIMIIASMLCALLTAGCAKTESNTNNNADNKEATTQAVTENTTESATENATENITEAITEAVTSAEPKEVITIKIPSYDKNADLGITVDCTDSNYKYLNVTTLKDIEYDYQLTDEAVKEIFNISVYNFSLSSNIVKLDEKVKVSIPYQEGMYVIYSADGVGYDLNAEYIDGKYVFETDTLGQFIFSTESTGRTEPIKTENVELAEQTITDERTGVQVSGMLPVDAKMNVTLEVIDSKLLSIQENSFYDAEAGIEHTFLSEFPSLDNPADYCYAKTEVENIAELITDPSWTVYEGMTGGRLQASVVFTNNFEILEFESDLTVTLPFDYREGLRTGNVSDDAIVEQYNYNTNKFASLEVISAEETAQGTFQFKTKTPGRFFFGTK